MQNTELDTKHESHTIVKKVIVTTSDEQIIHMYTEFSLYINSFDNTNNSINTLLAELNTATKKDFLVIYISSNGGSVQEGVQIINTINARFKPKHIKVILLSHAYSMGALMLLAFKNSKRIAYHNTSLMIHAASTGFSGKQHELLAELHHKDKWLVGIYNRYLSGFFTDKEISQLLDGSDFWLLPKDMLERGIITRIK